MPVSYNGDTQVSLSSSFPFVQNELNVGNTGVGTARISGGSDLVITGSGYNAVNIGYQATGNGTLTVTGSGSSFTSTGGAGNINVGRAGEGQLTITNGGSANGFFVVVGREDGSDGLLQVNGPGSRLTVSDEFGNFTTYTGYAGFLRAGRDDGSYGRIEVTNGGRIDVQNDPNSNYDVPVFSLGRNYGSTGVLLVDGEGSRLNLFQTGPSDDAPVIGDMPTADNAFNGPYFSLGYRGGTGRATVQNNGTITITGEDSALEIGQQNIGGAGRNEFSIFSGGEVILRSEDNRVGARVTVGREEDTEGILRIDGEGSRLRIVSDKRNGFEENRTSELLIGERGEGTLRLTNGAEVFINGANDAFPKFIVGEGRTDSRPSDADGTAVISGQGTKLALIGSAGENLGAGAAGVIGIGLNSGSKGELTVRAGAKVQNTADNNSVTIVAGDSDTKGALTISGSQSRFEAGELLVIGASFNFETGATNRRGGGDGKVVLTGGRLEADDIFIGDTGRFIGDIVLDDERNEVVNFGLIDGDVELLGGNDVLNSRNGELKGRVDAGSGRDKIDGSRGNDTLNGGNGSDEVNGHVGKDLLIGGQGSDTLKAGSGNDTVNSGMGNDVVFLGGGNDRFFDTGQSSASGRDKVFGGGGRDTIIGRGGSDTLVGNEGNDLLIGGDGNDTLNGGLGADTFVFADNGSDDVIRGGIAGNSDVIRIDGVSNPDDVTISLENGNTVFAFGSSTVEIDNFDLAVDNWSVEVGDNQLLYTYDTVICTHMHRHGYISEDVFKWDGHYGKNVLGPTVLSGYHLWAVPLVKYVLQKSPAVTRFVAPAARAWAVEMAHRCDPINHSKGSLWGRLMLAVGVPICLWIGLIRKAFRDEHRSFEMSARH